MTARSAVSVTPAGQEEPIFGAVWFAAKINTDRDERIVHLDSVDISRTRFPEATPEQIAAFESLVTTEMTNWNPEISLDRILTALDTVEKRKQAASDLKNTPPKTHFPYSRAHSKPSLLWDLFLKPLERAQDKRIT